MKNLIGIILVTLSSNWAFGVFYPPQDLTLSGLLATLEQSPAKITCGYGATPDFVLTIDPKLQIYANPFVFVGNGDPNPMASDNGVISETFIEVFMPFDDIYINITEYQTALIIGGVVVGDYYNTDYCSYQIESQYE